MNTPQKHSDEFADAMELQAEELINQGKPQEAEVIYRELIKTGTTNHIVYGNLAAICGMQGKIDELISLLNRALLLKPDYPEAHSNLGNAFKEKGDLNAAINSYKIARQLQPNNPYTHFNLGNTLQEKDDLNGAIASYNTAIRLNPDDSVAHNNLGNVLKEQGNLSAAIASYNTALTLNPDYPQAHNNLGNALQEKGDLNGAIASYNTAIRLNPDYSVAHNNLGNVLKEQGNLSAAIASYNTALTLNPDDPQAHNNLGTAFKEKGDFHAAIACYNAALKLNPDYPGAHLNKGLTMLLCGNYEHGLKEYEWRSKTIKGLVSILNSLNLKPWNENPLDKERKLFLIAEQGLGDTLQFMRYAKTIKNQGIDVALCAQEKLHTLIQASGIDPSPLNPQQTKQISAGEWIPLLSMPKHLGVNPNNPVVTEPYIKTTNELVSKWAAMIRTEERPIIGINWQGNPTAEKTGLRGRSMELETFSPIATNTNFSLLSLQKGYGSDQLESCSFKDRFVACQDQVNDTWDFLETAAIIANCDLVVTSDTSVAHLAGGMGKTTWLLLHKVPDWRWGLDSDTTFWYPSMRLFRQTERGNWDEVMERVLEALQKHFKEDQTSAELTTDLQATRQPTPNQNILAPVSLGELIDKITILEIKYEHLNGKALENVRKELEALKNTLNNLKINIDPTLIQQLKEINQSLWQIEDDIRDQERQKSFGKKFIDLARSVYQKNDQRADIKKKINTIHGSAFMEEKSYQQY
ncbi:MAG: DUF6165 family protein [Synechococcus sp.]